jgi:hypothetical protein
VQLLIVVFLSPLKCKFHPYKIILAELKCYKVVMKYLFLFYFIIFLFLVVYFRSQDSVVSIATSHTLDGPWFQSWEGQQISCSPETIQIGCGAHPTSYSVGTGVISWGYFLGVKQSGY